jgi:hypothetical protein
MADDFSSTPVRRETRKAERYGLIMLLGLALYCATAVSVSGAATAQNVESALALSARCAGVTMRAAMQEVADTPAHYAMHRQHDYWRAQLAAEASDRGEAEVLLTEAIDAAERESYRRIDARLVRTSADGSTDVWQAAFRQMAAECAETRAAREAH